MSMEERTPLLTAGQVPEHVSNGSQTRAGVKPTPLPKLQFFCVCFIQFSEPITAIVVYPFIVQLVRDNTGADENHIGYLAGVLVCLSSDYSP